MFPCDYIESETCWYNRQVGDSITLAINVSAGVAESYAAQWSRFYSSRIGTGSVKVKIQQEQCPWNIVIGSEGLELRVSPITDTDVDRSIFSAKIFAKDGQTSTNNQFVKEVNFKLNVLPIDMGMVYSGEEIVINMENFLTLPVEGMTFKWGIEKAPEVLESLPSNIKISKSGRSVTIKELKGAQGGSIVSCIVYSFSGIAVAKKRFLIRKPTWSHGMVSRQLTVQHDVVDNKKYPKPKRNAPEWKRLVQSVLTRRKKRDSMLSSSFHDESFFNDYFLESDSMGNYVRSRRYENQPGQFYASKDWSEPEEGTLFGTIDMEVHYVQPIVRLITHESLDVSDEVPVIIYNCSSHLDCGPRGSCIFLDDGDLRDQVKRGRCQCDPGYQGDGWRCHRPSHFRYRDKRIKRDFPQISTEPPINNRNLNANPEFENSKGTSAIGSESNKIDYHNSFAHQPNPASRLVPSTPHSFNPKTFALMSQFQNSNAAVDSRAPFDAVMDSEDSNVVATCEFDSHCSPHATCSRIAEHLPRCKCHPGYRGNGIFCWEISDYVVAELKAS